MYTTGPVLLCTRKIPTAPIELEKDMESVYHIQAVKNFLHCRYVDYGEDENSLIEFYGYTIEDILNDNKYNH